MVSVRAVIRRLSLRSSRGLLFVAVVLVVVAGGCKVDATVDVRVREDGSGVVRVLVTADAEAVKAVESGGVPLEQAVRLEDLVDAGWDVGAWARAEDGSATVVFSKPFGAPEDVAHILDEVSGEDGPLRGVRAAREAGFLATEYSVRGKVDLESVKTGVPTDEELVASLTAQGVDPNVIDQQLLAQLTSSFSLKIVVRLPGHAPITVEATPAEVTTVDASSSVRNTQRIVLLIAALGFAGLAVIVWRRAARRRRRRSTRPGRHGNGNSTRRPGHRAAGIGRTGAGNPSAGTRARCAATGHAASSAAPSAAGPRDSFSLNGSAPVAARRQAVIWRQRVGSYRRRTTPKPMPSPPRSDALLLALRLVAPGAPLREGIERVIQAHMGALIVVGAGPDVLSVCSGGFLLDAEFTPQRLSELAKMDGAIILTGDCQRIVRANVHLVPDPNIPTNETGTRHRTAERVARQIEVPVITISEDRSEVAIHVSNLKEAIEPTPRVLARADQALQILERYKARLDTVSGSLSALEVEDLVTVRDVSTVLQRAEMVRRIAEEIEGYVVELGADGRLVMLQLEELIGGVEDDRRLVAKDYYASSPDWELVDVMKRLAALDDEALLDLHLVAGVLHLGMEAELDNALQPRGFRLLQKIPRLPEVVSDHVVERFSNLQKIMRASEADLVQVDGVGEARARAIKDGFARLAETSILERYT